jgi:magnesium-protoporphyrin IX monomethyl ester (oxidative) cyclase
VNNAKLEQIDESGTPEPIKTLRKLPYYLANGVQFLKLYLMKPIDSNEFQPAVR